MSDYLALHSTRSAWARGIIVVRVNPLIGGHPAASRAIIEAVLEVIRLNCTPIIPFRGTASESSDLMPLVCGALNGRPYT